MWAWAESSALSFVNSMIGARTNREGGPGALAAAILGKTANYGLHKTENRKPTIVIEADIGDSLFEHSLLGQAVGMRVGGGIPYYRGIRPGIEEGKTMAAAMAAAGAVAMFHVEGTVVYGEYLWLKFKPSKKTAESNVSERYSKSSGAISTLMRCSLKNSTKNSMAMSPK